MSRLDLTNNGQAEFLTKLIFAKEHALCHEVNHVTQSSTNIDLVVGFTSGDIIWYEPMSQKYARLNKNVSHSAIHHSTRAQTTLIFFQGHHQSIGGLRYPLGAWLGEPLPRRSRGWVSDRVR